MTMDALRDWTTFGTDGQAGSGEIRYFSGTATYATTLTLTAEQAAKMSALSIGALPSGMARVRVNGVEAGVVWCAPWKIAATFKTGVNQIEIDVTNNWYNRLLGDCFLTPDTQVTKSTLRYWKEARKGDPVKPWSQIPTIFSGYSVSDALQPAGLLGPVTAE